MANISSSNETFQSFYNRLNRLGFLVTYELLVIFRLIFLGRFFRKTTDHPYETMYSREEFFTELEKLGFKITTKKICKDFNLIYFLVIT